LKETVNELRGNIHQGELQVDSNDNKCHVLGRQVEQLKEVIKELEEKLNNERAGLARTRLNMKETEKLYLSLKISHESLKEQYALSLKEIETLVKFIHNRA